MTAKAGNDETRGIASFLAMTAKAADDETRGLLCSPQ